jgi:hypothetical protein
MKYPFRVSNLNIRHTQPRYIIIHHTWCQYQIPKTKIDNQKYQMNALYSQVMEKKIVDLNYHYIIEQIKDDYSVITARPFVATCDYPDLEENLNHKGIHIALLGNYNIDMLEKRAYEVLAYRVLSPLMKLFSISPSKVFLHSEVSFNDDEQCPGDFFNKEIALSFVKRFLMK